VKYIIILFVLISCGKELIPDNYKATPQGKESSICYENLDCRYICETKGFQFKTRGECIGSFSNRGIDVGSGVAFEACLNTLESCLNKRM
jgi:hypothetical protein